MTPLYSRGCASPEYLAATPDFRWTCPDPFQLCHVGRVDLVQGGVAVVRDRAAVGDPVVAGRARELLGRERRSRGTAAARCRETDHHNGRDHDSRPDELEQTPMTAVECEEAMHRVSFGVG